MRIAVYIPSESAGEVIPADKRERVAENVRRSFAKQFGGYTEFEARGGFVSSASGELVEEPVSVVYALIEVEENEQSQRLAYLGYSAFAGKAAHYIAKELRQATALYEIDNVPTFVAPNTFAAEDSDDVSGDDLKFGQIVNYPGYGESVIVDPVPAYGLEGIAHVLIFPRSCGESIAVPAAAVRRAINPEVQS